MCDIEDTLTWIRSILPEPFKTEFLEEVLTDNINNAKTLNKIFMYYIIDCKNELPESVINKVYDKYIMINY